MKSEFPACSLSWLICRAVLLLVCCADTGRAQAPANIGGRTFELTVGWSRPGSGLAPAGSKFRFLPSETDNRYDVVPISPTVSPSTGTFAYQSPGGNTATLIQIDDLLGTGTVNCTFSTPTTGTYRTFSSGIEVQTGSFVMSAVASPASIAGSLVTITVTSGMAPFAGAGAVYRVRPDRPDAAGPYTMEGTTSGSVAFNSDGSFSYSKNPAFTGRVVYQNDRLVGSGMTSKLFFNADLPNGSKTGTVTLIHQAGWTSGYQTGTFTFAPNTAPTIGTIADATINEDSQTNPLAFTVSDVQTLPASLTVSAVSSSNPTVIPLSGISFGGSGSNRTVTVRPAENQFSTTPITITVTVTDGGGLSAPPRSFTVTVNPVNDPPTIAPVPIANQTTAPGTPTPAIPFTINDPDPGAVLTVTGASTITALVPVSGIAFGGSGANRTVTVTPVAGQSGSSLITLTVRDQGNLTASTTFTVTINAPPTISNIPDTVTNEDTATGPIPFTINDTLTPLASLALSYTSTNPGLTSSIVFGGSNGSRNITVTPAANQSGSSSITVTVTDGGGAAASDSFLLTVNAVNDPPVVSAIPAQTTNPGVSTAAIPFTISDVDSLPANFSISGRTSSNTALVPVTGIVVSGAGANRTVTVTPTAGQTGTADITITVSDGQATASATFSVTVIAPSLIAKGTEWKYLAPLTAASAPSASWTGIGYSDATWGSGPAPIGYGGDGEVTAIPTASGKPFTMYLRRKFTVSGAAGTLGLRLNLRRDDGAVVYLNGAEKWRSNMPEGVTIAHATAARAVVGGENETAWFTREVRATGLQNGDNVVAVEVHQNDAASSDLGFDLEVVPLSYAPDAPPWISDISDRSLAPGAGSGAIAFKVGDAETAAASLSVTAASSSPAVIPAGNMILSGSGTDRTIGVTAPANGLPGSSLITVTVSDGRSKAATAFAVTVLPSSSSVKVAAWGDNDRGQLGNNSTSDSSNPVGVSFTGTLAAKTPVQAAAGEGHSLVLFSDGTLAAWGRNDEGQLGTGNFTSSLVPLAVPVAGALAGKTVMAIDAGRFHSIALCSDGTIACWGGGGYGELGNIGTANSAVPVQVVNTGVLAGKTVISIAAGSNHNLALCSDGTIAAWGMNYDGALGINLIDCCRYTPVAVQRTGPLLNRTVTAISAGYHSFALCSDGTLAGWGDNQYGQLGNNDSSDSAVPVEVSRAGVLSTRTPIRIAAGSYHSLAVCTDGRVAAWGYNGSRQLGDGSTSNRYTPVLVSNSGALAGKFAHTVAAGLYSSAAVCTDGTAVEWGDSTSDITAINFSGLLPGHTVFDIAAGSFFKLALTSPPPAPFKVTTMHHIAAGDVFVGFPTLEGVPYRIEWSDSLNAWANWGTVNGIGGELITRLPGYGAIPRRFFRAVVDQ